MRNPHWAYFLNPDRGRGFAGPLPVSGQTRKQDSLIFNFIMERDNLSYYEAMIVLAARANVTLPTKLPKADKRLKMA